MSCDHELANEWAHCSGKNASYITIKLVHQPLIQLLTANTFVRSSGADKQELTYDSLSFSTIWRYVYCIWLKRKMQRGNYPQQNHSLEDTLFINLAMSLQLNAGNMMENFTLKARLLHQWKRLLCINVKVFWQHMMTALLELMAGVTMSHQHYLLWRSSSYKLQYCAKVMQT